MTSLYAVAVPIADILLKEERTKLLMQEALVSALERAGSFATAKQIATMLTTVKGFTPGQLKRLAKAAKDNTQVLHSWGVPEMIESLS